MSQPLAAAFQALEVAASIWYARHWHVIHHRSSVVALEFAHGKGPERYAYNGDGVARVFRERRTWHGRHAGFSDFFVPIGTPDRVDAVLVSGPFATERPTSTELLTRWYALTGRQGHASDPEFARYLSMTMDVLTLPGDRLQCFQNWLEHFAALLAGKGDARRLSERALSLLHELERARYAERVWKSAATMVDERTEREWLAPHSAQELASIGLPKLPDSVLFGLIVARLDSSDTVADALERSEFQRACVELATSAKVPTISGKVGEHAITFLVCGSASRARTRTTLERLADRAQGLARERFGLSLHFGSSSLFGTLMLSTRYDQAMSAAERALARRRTLVFAEPDERRSDSPMRSLRHQIGLVAEQRPRALGALFERYIQAVYHASSYRIDLVRAHLQTGFDDACQPLVAAGTLDEKGYLDICDTLERASRDIASAAELGALYQLAISDLVALVEHPAQSGRDRNLRRAIAFIDRHFAEPLRSAEVAKIAGFAPAHFCRLFRQRERMTFEGYLRKLRIERAQQLLTSTDLDIERVGQLAGFRLRPYFHRAFKATLGMTPSEYRAEARALPRRTKQSA